MKNPKCERRKTTALKKMRRYDITENEKKKVFSNTYTLIGEWKKNHQHENNADENKDQKNSKRKFTSYASNESASFLRSYA